eukprot:544937_1
MDIIIVYQIVMSVLLSVWTGTLFVVLLRKLWKNLDDSLLISKKVILSALFNFGGWSICYLFHTIIRLNNFINLGVESQWITFMHYSFTVIYPIAFVSSYIFVISMVYSVFKGSEFQISRITIFIHLTLSVILLFSCSAAMLFFYVIPKYNLFNAF